MYRIGQVADLTGLSRKTLRFYETKGILDPVKRGEGGFRLYDDRCLRRLCLIKQAKMLGFSLAEIKTIVRYRKTSRPPCQLVRLLLTKKANLLRWQLSELEALQALLAEQLACLDRQLKPED